MSIPALAVKKHVMTWMIALVLILFGTIGYFDIPIQKLPNAERPTVWVTTKLSGASPQLVNSNITQRIEEKLNEIDGVTLIKSHSTLGESVVEVDFDYGYNLTSAISKVQSGINAISNLFPENTGHSIIQVANLSGGGIMTIAFYGDTELENIGDYVEEQIKKKIASIDGVANVTIDGYTEKKIHVEMNLDKMNAYKLTPGDIIKSFEKHHVSIPGGMVSNSRVNAILNLDMEYHSVEGLKTLAVGREGRHPVPLEDIASVTYKSDMNSGEAKYNGKPAVGINIVKMPVANTVQIVNDVKSMLETQIKPTLPSSIHYKIIAEDSTEIKEAAGRLERDIWLSILSAGLIIYVFLLSIRATLIVAIAIPTSILGVVAVMYFCGLTFNVMTLLGIVLLVGVVVDDAIIVLENIYRKLKYETESCKEKAVEATNEVMFSVMTSTITLVVIFVPILFLNGEINLYFKSFATVVVSGVLISFLISVTMTPMLCARFYRVRVKKQSKMLTKIKCYFSSLDTFYLKWLLYSLNKPIKILCISFLIFSLAIPAAYYVKKEFMPTDKQEDSVTIKVVAPDGASNDYVQGRLDELFSKIVKLKGIKYTFSSVMESRGILSFDIDNKQTSRRDLMMQSSKIMKNIPGAIYRFDGGDDVPSLSFNLQGDDLDKLLKLSRELLVALKKEDVLEETFILLGSGQPEIKVSLRHALISQYGLSTLDVTKTISSLSSDGLVMGYYNQDSNSKRTEIILNTMIGQVRGKNDLYKVNVRNSKGKLVGIETVAFAERDLVKANVSRNNLEYSIGFKSFPTISMSDAIVRVQQVAKKILPKGYFISLSDNTLAFKKTMEQMQLAVFLTLILIYIVLASQFNSFIQPLIVMLAIPLAVVGGFLLLWACMLTFNVYSIIGMLLLMGLVAKNSILLIDLTHHYREEGMSAKEALLKACPIRMHPIIMTSLTIIFALLPGVLFDAGSSHVGLSIMIIGGMISSTILSLLLVPATYLLIENFKDKRGFH